MDKPFTPSVAAPSQHNVAGQDGKKGLGLRQVGVAKVVKTTLREDLGTSLEPHGLIELHTSIYLAKNSGVTQPRVPNIAQRAWINSASR